MGNTQSIPTFSILSLGSKSLAESPCPIMRCCLNIYELDEQIAFAECSVLRFDLPDEAWLDFVCDNRSGNYAGETYDFVYGPVANDDVYTTFTLYSAGVLNKAQTLEALKIKQLYNQLVLSSDKALSYLKFVGTVPKEE